MRHLTVNDIDTAFIDEGTGEPVVLLHGMAATSDIWRYTVEALKGRYRVVAPDLPGHGRSEGRARPYGLRFYARWLDGLLDALKLGRVTLFGSSMGGAISLDYAARHPQRVRRLVMVDALGLGPDLPVGGMGHVIANLPNFAALAVTGRPDPYLFRYLRGVVMVDPEGIPARGHPDDGRAQPQAGTAGILVGVGGAAPADPRLPYARPAAGFRPDAGRYRRADADRMGAARRPAAAAERLPGRRGAARRAACDL